VDVTVAAEQAAVDGGGGDGALCLRGQSEREGEEVWHSAQMSEGRWASRA
jgi:hypothetical protein